MRDHITNPDPHYTIRVTGPGVDSMITIKAPCDLEIVRSLIGKIERHLYNEHHHDATGQTANQ